MRERKEKMKGEARTEEGGSKNRGWGKQEQRTSNRLC